MFIYRCLNILDIKSAKNESMSLINNFSKPCYFKKQCFTHIAYEINFYLRLKKK